MADHEFDIEEYMKVFKSLLVPHVEYMWNKQCKNFHIFDRSLLASLTDIAARYLFVCCALTNFNHRCAVEILFYIITNVFVSHVYTKDL